MSFWNYDDEITSINTLKLISTLNGCFFCGRKDWDVVDFYEDLSYGEREGRSFSNGESICMNCGWWSKTSHTLIIKDGAKKLVNGCSSGSLKNLDLHNINTPLLEINNYLIAKYDDRFNMSWQLFEDLVGSVFKNLGYVTQVTGRSNDGGIDVIMTAPNNEIIGVQVKRYKNSSKAEQIRSLIGALVIGGITKGVFITTSDFQPSAIKTADLSTARGLPIELINAKRFYEALQLTNKLSWSASKRSKLKIVSIKSYYP